MRTSAAYALGQLGEHAKPAVPALTKYLESDDKYHYGTSSFEWYVRRSAAEVLGKLGEHSKAAVEALAKCLYQDSNENVRTTVVQALGKLGEHAKPAVPALTKYIGLPDNINSRTGVPYIITATNGNAGGKKKRCSRRGRR